MSKIILLLSFIFLLTSCAEKTTGIKISGKINAKDAKTITFNLAPTDIAIPEYEYVVEVNDNSTFSITIPSDKSLFGSFSYGHFYHWVFLSPNDDLFINIEEDTLLYTGKGADRNMFLYKALERKGCNGYYKIARYSKEINDMIQRAGKKHKRCLKEIEDNAKKFNLSADFKNFIILNDQVQYEGFLLYSYIINKRKNKNSDALPPVLKNISKVNNFVDDSKLSSKEYLYNVRNFIFLKRSELKQDKSDPKSSITTIMFDSLTGMTKVYAITNWLEMSFKMDRYDTLIYDRFTKEIKDSLALATVQNSYDKYTEKQKLIGKPLNDEFKNTLLEDDKGNTITFAEMVNKHKGKVIFLDIWSLGCGPCRSNMPKSNALKKKLAGQPIEFVYITEDSKIDSLWQKVYDVSLTKDNHYRFVNGRDAKLLKYMNIVWVPDYMIINKEGNLVNYNAMQPADPKLEAELMKYLK